jgi:Do/DeqQ family serine protease
MMFTRRRGPTMVAALAMALLVPLSASAQARASGAAAPLAGATSIAQVAEAAKTLDAIQLSFREIAKKVLPVVVKIDVVEVVKQPTVGGQSPFRFFFGFPRGGDNGDNGDNGNAPGEMRVNGLGSGIIVRRAGNTVYVLTNNHVVESATEVKVKLNDRRTFSAKVVGKDARRDIALVSFETKDAVALAELGDSSDLQVGDLVMAVGNPFGYESTLTMGIVSALGRSAPQGQTFTDYIQTDASINEGNSGGALVNTHGQVVGINTWIAAPTGGSVGIGFAIPINNAKSAIDDFITKGKVEYGWLGVQIGDIQDPATYPGFAKDLKVEDLKGAFVLNTYKGSPADRAGLLPGDYVLRADGQDIRNADHLTQIVGAMVAGRTYDLDIVRYGKRQKLSVKIGARDDKDEVAQYKNLWPGMTVVKITADIRKEASIAAGVEGVVIGYIPDTDTPAAIAGFRPGDVITEINGKAVRTMMDFYRGINDRSKKDVTFRINRKNVEVTIGLGR